eukprot:scaffold32864_cov28-Tisochrysis_lutea.AAC.3
MWRHSRLPETRALPPPRMRALVASGVYAGWPSLHRMSSSRRRAKYLDLLCESEAKPYVAASSFTSEDS